MPYGLPDRFPTDDNPLFITSNDFNDGKSDPVKANYWNDTISMLLGNGNRTSPNQTTYSAGIIVDDFNNNTKLDLAIVNNEDNTVSILLGNGDRTFQNQTTCTTVCIPQCMTISDFNNDSTIDLAVTDYNNQIVNVLLGQGLEHFQHTTHVRMV